MTLAERLKEYITAAFSGIWLQSYEHEDALREIAQLCRDQKWALATWDIDRGLSVSGGDPAASATDPIAAIRSINALAKTDSSAILVLGFGKGEGSEKGRGGVHKLHFPRAM